jgi:L-threonylcarbamoyladenylate synthase
MARNITLDSHNVDATAAEAASVLWQDGVVLYPTDTVYGIGVDATNTAAVEEVLQLKQRLPEKGISVMVPDADTMHRYVSLNVAGARLARTLLPGALTLVGLPKVHMPELVTGGTGAVAVRVPDHTFCLAFAAAAEVPITATSANVSGKETETAVDDILEQLGDTAHMIELAIDAGACLGGVPSTVVDATGVDIDIIREGAIDVDTIERIAYGRERQK